VQESYRTPNHQDQKRNIPRHIIIRTLSTQNKERILKATKEKRKVIYKGKLIRITAGFSTQTLNARSMERHNPGLERKQLSTQTSLPSKIIHPN
jgi:hypothetical protein